MTSVRDLGWYAAQAKVKLEVLAPRERSSTFRHPVSSMPHTFIRPHVGTCVHALLTYLHMPSFVHTHAHVHKCTQAHECTHSSTYLHTHMYCLSPMGEQTIHVVPSISLWTSGPAWCLGFTYTSH